MNPLYGLASEVVGGVVGWFAGRRRIAEARVEAEVEIQRARATADINWDELQAQNAATSWKDELWTVILAAPFVATFIPPLQPYVEIGFQNLESVPDYYMVFVSLAIGAAFGYRQIVEPFMDRLRTR